MYTDHHAVMEMTTSRLLLRPWRPDDPDDVAAAFDLYRRIEVARWLGAEPKPWASTAEAHERLARWGRIAQERPGFGMWALAPVGVARPIGTVLLVPLPDAEGEPTDDVEIGWHVHPDHWGAGYATEAAGALLEHAFGDLALDRVNAVAYAGNEPSFAVMRRIGMRHVGPTDRWYGTQLEWWAIDAPA